MKSRVVCLTLSFVLAAVPLFLVGCSSGSSGSSFGSGSGGGTQDGSVNLMVSDASTDDWATIGVKILSISLIPQGGGGNVNVYSASESTAPMINLVQLDQLGEILGNVTVPVGTYTGAVITISGNPSDITLTSAADPPASFIGTPGTTVPSGQIDVQGASGSAGSLTVSVTVNFVAPLVVSANQTNSLDLEFDLSHPAFLVGHVGGTSTVWAINFNGPVHHHPIPDSTRFLLRHIYGDVNTVATDGSSLTMERVFPVEPVAATAAAEAAITSTHSIQILPDIANGTLYYDVDAKAAPVAIKSFSTLTTSLPGKYVRVAARFQTGGTLVAVRIWASSTFSSLYVSPEGHLLHVNTTTDKITVENEVGLPVNLTVDSNTEFFFRTPWNAVADATPIGTGTAFLTNLERGFKIHASVVDPTVASTALVAQTVDIEIARYDGAISNPTLNGFTYTRKFNTTNDDYVVTLPFISSTTPNGSDPQSGNAITGFKWWNFTFPTIVDSGANAITDFDKATGGAVSFGGTAPPVTASGESYAWWSGTGWALPWTVLDPTQVQMGTAKTGYVKGTPTGSFTMVVPLGPTPVTINMSTASGSGTLVYQVDRTGAIVTITPVDITTANGQTSVATNLLASSPVNVFGVPQADGTIKAYVVFYYTGVSPTAVGF